MSLASAKAPDEPAPPTSILLGDVHVSPIVFQAIMDAGPDDVLNVLGLLDLDVGPAKARQVILGLAQSAPLWEPALLACPEPAAKPEPAAPVEEVIWTWEAPDLSLLPIEHATVPAFPVDLLGPFWSTWCQIAARDAGASVDYTAGTLLATIGAVLGNVRWGKTDERWEHPSVLWIGLIGSSSAVKSPAMRSVRALITTLDQRRKAELRARASQHHLDSVIADALRKGWVRKTEKLATEEFERTQAFPTNLAPMPNEAEARQTLVQPRLTFDDVTVEGVADHVAGLPRGSLQWSGELARWFGSFDRYRARGGSSDRGFWLEAFDGDPYTITRKGAELRNGIRAETEIPHLSIGVIGGTQPDKIRSFFMGRGTTDDDGLAHRFLWIWPNPGQAIVRRDSRATQVPLDMATANAAVMALDTLSLGLNDEPVRVPTSPEADSLLEDYRISIIERAQTESAWRASTLGKAPGTALRLSCVLAHLRWSAERTGPAPTIIDANAMRDAIAMIDGYFLHHARRLQKHLMIGDAEGDACVIVAHIRDNKIQTFNATKLQRLLRGRLTDAGRCRVALNILIDAGLIRPVFERAGPRPGRPQENYLVNPLVLNFDRVAAAKTGKGVRQAGEAA